MNEHCPGCFEPKPRPDCQDVCEECREERLRQLAAERLAAELLALGEL